MTNIKVYSEIGKLNKVLVHKPGNELLHLTPEWLSDLLFDDIPWLEKAQEEHDTFKAIMEQHNIEVVELIDLVVESLQTKEALSSFINQFLDESLIENTLTRKKIITYFKQLSIKEIVEKTMSGILKADLKPYKKTQLKDYIEDYPFITDPMPNLYFTRDPFTIMGEHMSLHHMEKKARKRESIYGEYIYYYHKDFKDLTLSYRRNDSFSIEGGDILNINEKLLMIGLSERTEPEAIEKIAKYMLTHSSYKMVLAVLLPKKRTFMHLDTVFTQLDTDKFIIHPEFLNILSIYEIFLSESDKNKVNIKETKTTIKRSLRKHLNQDVTLIPCGGHNLLSADREQWNDGANVFAIAPGTVIAYERNALTNKKLEAHGIKVITIPSSELSRGRGGPRCMTMPLNRDLLK